MRSKKRQKPIFSNISEINLQLAGMERLDSPPVQEPAFPPETPEDLPAPDTPPTVETLVLAPTPLIGGPKLRPAAEPVIEVSPPEVPEIAPGAVAAAPPGGGEITGEGREAPTAAEMANLDALVATPAPGLASIEPGPGQEQEAERPSLAPQEVNPPALRLTADSHNFGRLLIGQGEGWDLIIYNDGDSDLAITGLDGLPAHGFKLSPPPLLPLVIPGQGLVHIPIQFIPPKGGEKRARLLVHSGQPAAPISEIALAGTAVEVISTAQGILYSPLFNSVGMAFVYIQAGSFLMGSPETEPGRRGDELQHEVTISHPFYLQTTPVTQRQWQALMGSNPAKFSEAGENCPVEGVSWHDCQEFLQRINSRGEGTYRLPTEAEWEYACRAGTITAFANGDITQLFCERDPHLDALGWYCYNADKKTHPVGEKQTNPWGLYDMHGQVGEWCQDWYKEYDLAAAVDPPGPPSGTEKVVRGGSWFAGSKNCRSASRFKWSPRSRSNLQVIGLRLVREI
jgi:formylglycine-generating enzyme required for sulfatase activity